MRSKATKKTKRTGARKAMAGKAAASKRGIPTINVKMPRSMWELLSEVGEKVFTKAARGTRKLNAKYAGPICLILSNGNKEAAAVLQERLLQAQKDFFASAGDAMKFAP